MPGATIQPGMGDRAARTMAAAAGGSARALMGLPRKVRDWAKGLQQEAKDYSRHKRDRRALADLLLGASPEEHERFREVYAATQAANRAAKNRGNLDSVQREALETAFKHALFPGRENTAEFLALSPEDRERVLRYDALANDKNVSPQNRQLARDRILRIYNRTFGPDESPEGEPEAPPEVPPVGEPEAPPEEEDDGLGEEQAGLETQLPKDNEGGVGVRRVASKDEINEAQGKGKTVAASPPVAEEQPPAAEPLAEEEQPPEEAEEEPDYDGYEYGHPDFPAIAGVGEEGDEDYVAGRPAISRSRGAKPRRIYNIPLGMQNTPKRRLMLSRLGYLGNVGGQLYRDQLKDPETGVIPFSPQYRGLKSSHTANILEGMRDSDTGEIFSMTDDGEIDFKETEKRYNEEVAKYINYLKSIGVDEDTLTSQAGKVTAGLGKIKPFSGRGSFLDAIASFKGDNTRDPAAWEYDSLEGPQETMAEFPDVEGAESYAVRPIEAALHDLLPNVHKVGRDAFLAQRKAQGFGGKEKSRTGVTSTAKDKEKPVAAREGTTEETDAFDMDNPKLTGEETTPQLAGNVADLIDRRERGGTPMEMAANESFAEIRDSLGENFAEVLNTPTGEIPMEDPLFQAVSASDATPLINYLREPLMDAATSLTDNVPKEQREKTLMEGAIAAGKRIDEVKAYYKQMLENESQLGKSDDPLDRAFDTFFKEEW